MKKKNRVPRLVIVQRVILVLLLPVFLVGILLAESSDGFQAVGWVLLTQVVTLGMVLLFTVLVCFHLALVIMKKQELDRVSVIFLAIVIGVFIFTSLN